MKSLDVSRPGEYVDARGMTDIRNMSIDRFVVRKRDGTSVLGASLGERVQAIFEYEDSGVTYCIRVGNTKVELLNKATSVWSSIANAALTGTDTDRVDWAFPLISAVRVAVFTNGIDNIRKYTGGVSDADLGGSPPQCKFMTWFGSCLLLAGIEGYPQRVQWSDTGDPETWSGGDANSVELLDDPESITGLVNWSRYVTIHKSNSIYVGQKVTTSEVYRFDRKPTGVGAVCHFTIQELPTGEQIFLAKDGIRLFNGFTAPYIESPVNDEIREEINSTHVGKAWAALRKDLNEYWLGVPIGSDTEPTTVYKYNWVTKQCYKDSRANVCAANAYLTTSERTWDDLVGSWDSQTWRWNDVTLSSLNPIVMFGETSGVTTRDDSTVNNDNGVAVNGYFDTKDFTAQDFDLPDLGQMIRWLGIEHWLKGNNVTFYYSTDSGGSWTKVETIALSSDYPDDSAPLISYFDVLSTKIRYRWRNNTLGETFSLKKYKTRCAIREMRR